MPSSPEYALELFRSKTGTKWDRSTSSGTAVSPAGSVGQPPTPVNRYAPRPAIKQRPHSESTAIQSRVNVHTIAEGPFGNQTAGTPHNASDSQLPTIPRVARSATPSRVPSVASRYRDLAQRRRHGMEARARSEASVLPSHRTHRDRVWSRSKSGGIWYERLRRSHSQSNDSSQCSDPSEAMMRLALTPLRPPQPQVPEPMHHQVKVETPFTDVAPDIMASPGYGSAPENSGSCQRGYLHRDSAGSHNPFSLPLRLVRRLCGRQAAQGQKANEFRPKPARAISKLQLPDHRSLLRRNRPAEALRQVTSILEEISPPAVIHPQSKLAFLDTPGTDAHEAKKWIKHDKRRATAQVSTHGLSINRSFPDLVLYDSQDSSQLDLRRAPCPSPQNTPEENAIYRVKRSPSAETEEFIKIDISIRGGTSYLPSEARRVHTPPPLQEGLDGRKRGFFFDYNVHKWPRWGGLALPAPQAGRKNDKEGPSEILPLPPPQHPGSASRIGRNSATLTNGSRFNSKRKDWYDAKLAELEVVGDETETSSEAAVESRPARGCSTTSSVSNSSAESVVVEETKRKTIKRKPKLKRIEGSMDFTIPEHLPTSPLCPRNSQYWRVVQGRGSQYRGCWMHGVGERK